MVGSLKCVSIFCAAALKVAFSFAHVVYICKIKSYHHIQRSKSRVQNVEATFNIRAIPMALDDLKANGFI